MQAGMHELRVSGREEEKGEERCGVGWVGVGRKTREEMWERWIEEKRCEQERRKGFWSRLEF